MAKKELVLDLGLEGGGATIYRTPLASGGWQFHVEGSSMFLDDNDAPFCLAAGSTKPCPRRSVVCVYCRVDEPCSLIRGQLQFEVILGGRPQCCHHGQNEKLGRGN